MASKEEKHKRKQLRDKLNKKQKEAFETSLPMPRIQFQKLFDFLEREFVRCDNTLKLTEFFLKENKIGEIKEVIDWLEENGGYCDCEVISNIEEKFE